MAGLVVPAPVHLHFGDRYPDDLTGVEGPDQGFAEDNGCDIQGIVQVESGLKAQVLRLLYT
jgi:hypothetical protein